MIRLLEQPLKHGASFVLAVGGRERSDEPERSGEACNGIAFTTKNVIALPR